MRRIAPIIIVVAIAAGFLYWWFSPVQIIKRQTENFLEIITLQASASPARRQLGGYSLNAILGEQVILENSTIPEANGTFDRAELESAYAWLCQQARHTRFDLTRFRSVAVEAKQATVSFTLSALVELPTYRPADGTYEVVFDWQKADDGWRLTAARWK